jgi:hypothetical protein
VKQKPAARSAVWIAKILAAIAICVAMQSCANQQPPQGGPVDQTTPEILSTYPVNNARNFKDDHISLEFDRYVGQRSLEESVFISPYVGTLEFDWSGKEVEIQFSEKLRDSTTYVVNIGTDVKDGYRNHKRMAQAYTLAFSTGPNIDRGCIEGTVCPMKESDAVDDIMIFAYHLGTIKEDTLNPKTSKPDFITQTGKSGSFSLRYIPFGRYRVFAVRDEYRNLVYDPHVDEYGVQSEPVALTPDDTLFGGLLMKLAKEDSTGPRLIKVAALDRNHVTADFSKSINPDSAGLSSFSIVDTTTRAPLDLIAVYPSPSSASSFTIVTGDQDSTKMYRLTVLQVIDSIGNKINPLANSLNFMGSAKGDSLPPKLIDASITDSVQNVDFRPTLTLTFSNAVVKGDTLPWLDIFDAAGHIVPSEKRWASNVVVVIRPEKDFESAAWYRLRAELRDLRDWAGRSFRDSVRTWRFRTLDVEDMSSVEGFVMDKNRTDTAGSIIVDASQIGVKPPQEYTAIARRSGDFVFPRITEGRYVFQAFRDRNGNGEYDPGKPFPFEFSERQSPLSDTLKVRARWPLEGVGLEMK